MSLLRISVMKEDYFGIISRITITFTPDYVEARLDCLAPPMAGCTVCSQGATIYEAIKNAFASAENQADLKLVERRIKELLEKSKR